MIDKSKPQHRIHWQTVDKCSEIEGLIYLMVDPPILSLVLARTVDWGGVPIAKVRGHLIITDVAMVTE